MKLGVISDIHGNLPALEAVLRDIPEDVDDIVCLGDVVGYGPWPLECLRKVWQHCDVVVQGNHDREFVDPEGYTDNGQAMEGLRYAKKEVKGSYREWLQNLPEKTSYNEDIFLVHSHPEKIDYYVVPRDFPKIRAFLDDYKACFLGHTHIQHKAVIDDRLILNPGSVGQPRDGDPRAAYAVVETEDWSAELRRVEYDIGKVQDMVEEQGLPSEIGTRLESGR
ncbi:metallophosphatase family protein [Natronomonas gomsonensis]|uniref:metallophosphoesterase family protein n=1 Tax=Natronomonas gomsonensis TaxID=1046043 RepID=UPI0020CA3CCB|nr:metallophosphoesterase family protein [Natronomonas gomsonensis]MCY4730481.1 metallophosphatase family protein [Natronomonas gomsonensis]